MGRLSAKDRIASCFMELVAQSSNPRDRVSVTELVGRLGMDRKSFYRHFDNTTDLVIWIFRSDIASLMTGAAFEGFRLECPDPALHDKYQDLPFYARSPLIDGSLDQSVYFKALCDLFNESFAYYQHILSYPCYLDFYYYLVNLYQPAIRNDIGLLLGDNRTLPGEEIDFLAEYHTIALIGRLPYHFTIERRPLPSEGLERAWNYAHETLRTTIDMLTAAGGR